MIIAGGVYAERCIAPSSEVMMGSAGRACLALRGHAKVELHTFHPDANDVRANFGRNAIVHPADEMISFDYLHPLARPRISPVPLPTAGLAHVAGNLVLRYGCLEGDFRVDAETAVYDPQNGRRSQNFGENGSTAGRLAIVLNADEVRALSGIDAVDHAGPSLRLAANADVVVVKQGAAGASVFDAQGATRVPAYRTTSLYKIGSGDVFSAMFALYWGVRRMRTADAADLASRQVAAYVSTRNLPCPAEPPSAWPAITRPSGLKVRIVADGDDAPALWIVDSATEALQCLGASVVTDRSGVASFMATDVVLALVRDERGAAISEARHAAASGLPVILHAERDEAVKAAIEAGFAPITDLAAAIYASTWLS